MMRLAAYVLLMLTLIGFLLTVDAPSHQDEAQDVAADVRGAEREAKRQARLERQQQWLEAEMLRRGCKP